MNKQKSYTFRTFCKLLNKNGYEVVSKNGYHHKYKNSENDSIVVNVRLNRFVAKRLIKEHDLKEF
jgi:predicted RNA binding protein YcfA (HicA-like mRNA interferase family)